MGYILIPVYCQEERIDLLTSMTESPDRKLVKNASCPISSSEGFNYAVSEITGEIFRVQEIRPQDSDHVYGTVNTNICGNNGSHYLGEFTFDGTGKLTYARASVPEIRRTMH